MSRFALSLMVVFLLSVACMGQTFQYSRGWVNGKRANSNNDHNFGTVIRSQPSEEALSDMPTITENVNLRLQRCMMQLQYLLHNPVLVRASLIPLSPNVSNQHQVNDLDEQLKGILEADEYAKH